MFNFHIFIFYVHQNICKLCLLNQSILCSTAKVHKNYGNGKNCIIRVKIKELFMVRFLVLSELISQTPIHFLFEMYNLCPRHKKNMCYKHWLNILNCILYYTVYLINATSKLNMFRVRKKSIKWSDFFLLIYIKILYKILFFWLIIKKVSV